MLDTAKLARGKRKQYICSLYAEFLLKVIHLWKCPAEHDFCSVNIWPFDLMCGSVKANAPLLDSIFCNFLFLSAISFVMLRVEHSVQVRSVLNLGASVLLLTPLRTMQAEVAQRNGKKASSMEASLCRCYLR